MPTLVDLTKIWDEFCCSAVENHYNNWQDPKDLRPIANKLIEQINVYIEEVEKENEERSDRL